jgi:hypothetical protein
MGTVLAGHQSGQAPSGLRHSPPYLARPGVNPVTGVFPRQQPAERPCQSQEERRTFARATPPTEDDVIERQKLEREIYEISKLIDANIVALKTKAMSDYDREALQRHMSTRVAHLKLLQRRLDPRSNKSIADRASVGRWQT